MENDLQLRGSYESSPPCNSQGRLCRHDKEGSLAGRHPTYDDELSFISYTIHRPVEGGLHVHVTKTLCITAVRYFCSKPPPLMLIYYTLYYILYITRLSCTCRGRFFVHFAKTLCITAVRHSTKDLCKVSIKAVYIQSVP